MSDKAELFSCPIVPVLTIDAAEQAVPLARVLQEVGFTALEVTFRTPHAAAAIAAMREGVSEHTYRSRHHYREKTI